MNSPSSDAMGGILFLGVIIVCALVGLAFLVFWIWMLIHALVNPGLCGSEKVAWVLLIFFVQLIGAIIYFFVGRPKAALRSPPT